MTGGITSHQARGAWCVRHLGADVKVHRRALDDSRLLFGVMEFQCGAAPYYQAAHWAYVTNGMSERRMPWREEPTIPANLRQYRLELIAYTHRKAGWVLDLLEEMARYPFVHDTGFAYGHTLPATATAPRLWDGYFLGFPPNHKEFNPLGIVADAFGGDPVFWLHVIGLKQPELNAAVERGGQQVLEALLPVSGRDELLFLDSDRPSFLTGP